MLQIVRITQFTNHFIVNWWANVDWHTATLHETFFFALPADSNRKIQKYVSFKIVADLRWIKLYVSNLSTVTWKGKRSYKILSRNLWWSLARASVWGAAHCFASAKMFREWLVGVTLAARAYTVYQWQYISDAHCDWSILSGVYFCTDYKIFKVIPFNCIARSCSPPLFAWLARARARAR